jgi:hypothetical protein
MVYVQCIHAPDEGPSFKTSKLSLHFSGSCIPNQQKLVITICIIYNLYEGFQNQDILYYPELLVLRKSAMVLSLAREASSEKIFSP